MIWRSLSTTLVGAATTVLAVACVGVSAPAAYACNSEVAREYVAVGTHEITTNGAEAYIERYNPRTCEGGSSAAWPMMFVEGSCSDSDFAQVGWDDQRTWGIKPHYFYEYGECGKVEGPMAISLVPSPEAHGFDHYAAYTQKSESEVLFTINGESVAKHSLTWKANRAEYATEVYKVGDQVPGDTNHHFKLYGLNHLYNGTWYSDNAEKNIHLTSVHGGDSFENGNYFYTWDTRYSTEE